MKRLRFQRWVLVLFIATGLMLLFLNACEKQKVRPLPQKVEAVSPLDARYTLEGQEVLLVNGIAESQAAPDSASKNITRVWGKPKIADINGDGKLDAVVILVHNSGGSGTFYYAAAAIAEGNAFRGTKAVLLGDRIQPTKIEVTGPRATVHYLDHAPGEAFSVSPATLRQQTIIYDRESREFVKLAQDFEGEADPESMVLSMKTWAWVKTVYNNDTRLEPKEVGVFTITFGEGQQAQMGTDCNRILATYKVEGNAMQFTRMLSTKMFCENSQEQLFEDMLKNVNSYFFSNQGQLILELKFDSGSMIFQ